MSEPPYTRLRDPAELAEHVAGVIGDRLTRAVAERGRGVLAVAGGRTPVDIFERLSEMSLPWDRITVTLTDERFVPPDAPESNERLVHRHLLKDVAEVATFLPLWSRAATPEAAAERADAAIRDLGRLSVVLLGMGEDGHFASLFPGALNLADGLDTESARACIAVPQGQGAAAPDRPRLSLTLSALLNSDTVLLPMTGDAKRAVYEGAAAGASDVPVAALIRHASQLQAYWSPAEAGGQRIPA